MQSVTQRRMPASERQFRRRFPRYKLSRHIRIHLLGEETFSRTVEGRWQELGRGGVGATLKDQVAVGQTVLLELSLALKVYGVVRYSRGFFHGFEFLLVRDKDKAAIEKICDAYEVQHQASGQHS